MQTYCHIGATMVPSNTRSFCPGLWLSHYSPHSILYLSKYGRHNINRKIPSLSPIHATWRHSPSDRKRSSHNTTPDHFEKLGRNTLMRFQPLYFVLIRTDEETRTGTRYHITPHVTFTGIRLTPQVPRPIVHP
jgi:hypothetical protein